ncbi:MAG: hypothetical protein AB7G47_23080 [Mycolicibacterium sp.]|uniref:hypothetical protein n=1 Tax=Mycolicibacterium sp. TaxID=2320850 RepID=UPI003D12163B
MDTVDATKVIAVVFTPLQSLNLVEYCRRFGRQVDVVMVGVFSSGLEPHIRTQIEAALSVLSPREIIYHESELRSNGPVGARRLIMSAAAALRSNLTTSRYEFVVGEYRSHFAWAVQTSLKSLVQRVIVVDDGSATLRIDRRGSSLLRSPEVRRQKLAVLTLLAMGIRAAVPSTGLTFFTAYAINDRLARGDAIVRNDYRNLSAELRSLPPDDDSVYVIGGPHWGSMPRAWEEGEIHKVDLELALELSRFAAEYTGKEVIYMAHRRESAEKLDGIRKEFKVATPTVPFEIYPRVVGKRPRAIVGYYSSVIVTAAELLGDSVDIIALQIPRDRMDVSWHPFIDEVYQYFLTELRGSVRVVDPPSDSTIA